MKRYCFFLLVVFLGICFVHCFSDEEHVFNNYAHKFRFLPNQSGSRTIHEQPVADANHVDPYTGLIDNVQLKHLPQKHDWRDFSAVTPVKNQKNCGACWAFSTVETMESMHKLQKGSLVELSVQQVIDCARGENYGCSGGDTCGVMKWMNETRYNITTATEYPLTDVTGICQQIKSRNQVRLGANFTCKEYIGNEEEMVKLLAEHGPLVAAVDATTWQDYLGGILQYNCDSNTNHAVQIVGYDLTGDVPYYIVRNSWGTEFGIDGYLYIAIGKNLCGLATHVSTISIE